MSLTATDRQALAGDLAQLEHDPVGYVLWAFPWGVPGTELEKESGPRTWQREELEKVGLAVKQGKDLNEVVREAISSGHGIGKSALVAWLLRWALATREDTRAVVTANTEPQLRTKTWPEVAKWHRLAIDRDLSPARPLSRRRPDGARLLFLVARGKARPWRQDSGRRLSDADRFHVSADLVGRKPVDDGRCRRSPRHWQLPRGRHRRYGDQA